ncbi:MAG: cytochrome c1 [Piscirickettsiaceae bacterium]|nr:cytochrome c1 [Piscirickettsiaceae bacterium]
MKILILAIFINLLYLSSGSVIASGDGVYLDKVDIEITDKASLQRGAKIFVNYCLSCHQASYMRYNRMGKDIGLTDRQVIENLMFASNKIGDTMTIAMRGKDAKKWFGMTPPDLSVISRARGTDWLYTYLRTFYLDESKIMGTNNATFKNVGMPHVLWKQQGYLKKEDKTNDLISATKGIITEHEYDIMIKDLTNFLAYLGEPSKIQRLSLAKWVLLYLVLFFLVAFSMKKSFWKDVS